MAAKIYMAFPNDISEWYEISNFSIFVFFSENFHFDMHQSIGIVKQIQFCEIN